MLKGESWKAQNAQKREKKIKLSSENASINWAIFMFLSLSP